MTITVEDLKLLYRHDLYSFIRFAFQILHPGVPYLDNWHVKLLADHLARVERGEITRLVINMPPRMLKSFCVSIAFAAWMLGRDPTKRILCLSAGQTLGKDLEESFHDLMISHRYRSVFPDRNITEKATKLQTPYGGYRRSLSMGAKLSGIPADLVIIDDLMSASDALNNVMCTEVSNYFDQNVLQRLDNKKEGAIIVVMQRLHEDDLSGHLLKKGGWVHLDLSAVATEDEEWKLSSGEVITRNPLDALHPERESFEELMKIRYSIGGYAFA